MNLRTTNVLAITIHIIERIKTGSNSPVLTLIHEKPRLVLMKPFSIVKMDL